MNEQRWRARAVAAETACAAGLDELQKLIARFEHGEDDKCYDMEPARNALAAMRAAASSKGEARANGTRRMRRSDALVLAQLAAGLHGAGHRGSAHAVAGIARRMAKLTGAANALAIAESVPASTEEPTLPRPPDRAQIADYFAHLGRNPIGMLDLTGTPASQIFDWCASWVRNRLDEKWAAEMRASGALASATGSEG